MPWTGLLFPALPLSTTQKFRACLWLPSTPRTQATQGLWHLTTSPGAPPPCAGRESDAAQGHGLGGFATELPSTCQCLDASVISMRPPGSAVRRAAKAIKNTSAFLLHSQNAIQALISNFHTSFGINGLNLINNPSLSHIDCSSARLIRQI